MSRQFTVHDKSWGEVTFFVIRRGADGALERPWNTLETLPYMHPYLEGFNPVERHLYDAALRGFPLQMLRQIKRAPDACLALVPFEHQPCQQKTICPHWDKKTCTTRSKDLPLCYELGLTEDMELRMLGTRLVEMWRQNIYTIIIEEEG